MIKSCLLLWQELYCRWLTMQERVWFTGVLYTMPIENVRLGQGAMSLR